MENSIPEQEEYLKKLLKDNLIIEPSNDFTKNVMDKISFQTQTNVIKYKSIISKKAWWVIITISLVLIFIVFSLSPVSADFTKGTNNYEMFSSIITNIINSITILSYKYIIFLLPVFFLFIIDKFISTPKTSNSYY
ncbi:MAG: hypothetical protein KAT68_10155 [Bacteroidales bacterium]|nr:hypothetical protein [Bacteroidales bacterium]